MSFNVSVILLIRFNNSVSENCSYIYFLYLIISDNEDIFEVAIMKFEK